MRIRPIEFKTKRQALEYIQLCDKNHPLECLLDSVNMFTNLEFDKNITITEIYRTPEETRGLYAHLAADKVPHSPHEIWAAADLRSFTFTEEEIKRIVAYCNTFRYKQGKPVALYHDIDGPRGPNAAHFHIQYVGRQA